MSIEKKSLISTLKTTKKANAASSAGPEATHVISKRESKMRLSKRESKMRLSKRESKMRLSKRESKRLNG
jgi:hypothetical protein